MALSTFKHRTQQTIAEVFHSNKEFKRYALAISAALLLSGSWFAYRSYTHAREGAAQQALMQCMMLRDKALTGDVQWADVASMSAAALDSYGSTALAPYLMACRVDALRGQGDYEGALAQSKKMIATLSKRNSLYGTYQIKDALLNLDYGDQAAQEAAQATLTELGSDSKNPVADRALYYLGLYQDSIGQHAQARKTWQQLLEYGAHEDHFLQSPYISLVQSKL